MGDTEMTLMHEQFMAQMDAKGNSMFSGTEKKKVPGSYRILFHEQKAPTVDNFLPDLDEKLCDLKNWEESHARC
jgi:hypothetical protein